MQSIRLEEFDLWRPGYGLATVRVLIGGTTQLASIFLDPALTQPAVNPQTLLQQTFGGISYGKWAQPLYTGQAYELAINSIDQTGIVGVPITTLQGQDASQATVIPTGAVVAGNLDDLLARRIDVRDYGVWTAVGQNNASAITNNATLTAAIAIAGGTGGGYVEIPGGTYQITSFILPAGVVLRGIAREATSLQSTISGNVCTLGGDECGLERITLDGINQVTGSIGVFAANINFVHMADAMIRRFDSGFVKYGGTGAHYYDLFVSNCFTVGYQPHGYSDNGNGGPLTNERWDGGKIQLCAGIGLDVQYVDSAISNLIFSGVGFDSNTGTAAQVLGGQQIKFDQDCWWNRNTTDLIVNDVSANPVQGVEFADCSFNAAIDPIPAHGSQAAVPATNSVITLSNTLANVAFRRCDFSYVNININSPSNNVLAQDCDEITGVALGGNTPTAWLRSHSWHTGETAGLTTTNAATGAWSIQPDPGERMYLEAKVVGRSRNTTDYAMFHISVAAQRPGSTLSYVSATANFTAGNVLTGQTSGATARITVATPSGTSGTLTLQDINGTFLNNEVIKDSGTGSANASGTPVSQNAALIGSVNFIVTTQKSDANWQATFAPSGTQVQLLVTGDTNMNVEWLVNVDAVSIG